jgi:hypothetical protein
VPFDSDFNSRDVNERICKMQDISLSLMVAEGPHCFVALEIGIMGRMVNDTAHWLIYWKLKHWELCKYEKYETLWYFEFEF